MRVKHRKARYVKGDYLIEDDISGEIIRKSQAKKLWNGNLCSKDSFEIRNPQDFIRAREERTAPQQVRPRKVEFIDNS